MLLSFRKLFTDKNNIEFSVIKTETTHCLCLQGKSSELSRIKKAYQSAKCFYPLTEDNIFEPLSVNLDGTAGLVSALFANKESISLNDFLRNLPKEWQYAMGKKLGRVLHQLHSCSLNEKQLEKAKKRHDSFMEHLATYVADLPHFKNDRFAMDAISLRYDHFKLFRPALRYGSLGHQKVMVTKDSQIVLLPTYTFGPGDVCEDFASLECESAGLYPLLCAGVIDGYFSQMVPAKFWMHFALYSALYSLWKCGLKARESSEMLKEMQKNSDRIRCDFNNFAGPIPIWYSDPSLVDIRKKASRLG